MLIFPYSDNSLEVAERVFEQVLVLGVSQTIQTSQLRMRQRERLWDGGRDNPGHTDRVDFVVRTVAISLSVCIRNQPGPGAWPSGLSRYKIRSRRV